MRSFVITIFLLASLSGFSQDLLDMLEKESNKNQEPDYATATFKATRLINSHSIETLGAGVLDVRISHRFGYVNGGISDLFGLDQATNRLALEYGVSNRLMVGVGRSSYQKQVDGFGKFKLLRQVTGGMPVTMSAMASVNLRTDDYKDPSRENYYSSRLSYAYQLLIARKFSESLSLQLMPEMIHYNLAETPNTNNNVYAVGIGGRIKLSKRISFNAEYHYQIPQTQLAGTYNSLAVGFDIETGGHVFQLHFTNSSGFTERNFIAETTGNVAKGDIRFGFHLSRVFTLKKPKK